MPLTEETRARAREIIARYPKPRSALLPMLHLVQADEGYVTARGIALCAEELGLTKAEVGAVATFYTMYKRRPTGTYLVSVCTNLSCQLLGGDEVYAGLAKKLGVGHDETTADGQITLEHAECLAACDYAPVLTVNYEFFDNVTEESAERIVDELLAGRRPHPSRGAPLVTFSEISRQLAGFVDEPVAGAGSDPGSTPAHPDAPPPDDRRGSVPLEGTDIAPPAAAGYGVPGGVTERVLPDAAAAASYGTGPDAGAATITPTRDAGATPESQGVSPRRDESGEAHRPEET